MKKIAQYLNGNLIGETLTTSVVRLNYSRDHSILRLIPGAVVFPRQTSDVRKVVKLSNQLGEKGKIAGLTARGRGHSQTGAAIGKDLVIDFNKYLNAVVDVDPDQGLIHTQAGTELSKITAIAKSHNLRLPFNGLSSQTIGGLLSSNNAQLDLRKIKHLSEAIDQLEVILANGDVIQTRRLSKRELDKKIGQANAEGELYRKIDKLIEDNSGLIDQIDTSRTDSLGYNSIALVRQKNGSFDLTPLLIGAQGTLGLISEAIIKLDIDSPMSQVIATSFLNLDDALDAQEAIAKLDPVYCQIYQANIFTGAMERGKSFSFYEQAFEHLAQTPAVCLLARFDVKNKREAKRLAKKLIDLTNKNKGFCAISEPDTIEQFESIRDVPYMFSDSSKDTQNVLLVNGVQVPIFRFRDFVKGLNEISKTLDIDLPYFGSCLDGIINIRTEFNLKLVSDKQKVFRLLSAITKLLRETDGIVCAGEGEGRVKSPFAYQTAKPELINLFSQIRAAFDPNHILNPGVKEPIALKDVISATVNDYYNGIFY